jgi:protein TonB
MSNVATVIPTRRVALAGAATLLLAACISPAPTSGPPASTSASPAQASSAPAVAAVNPNDPVRLAPRNPALESWKRSAAERIHRANQKNLFEGRPHHLLQAVIVVEATVDKGGNVVTSRITRSPKIKKLDDMALASLKAASPLPAPPPTLLVRGNLVFSETWLVQNDGTYRVRTLTLPQE